MLSWYEEYSPKNLDDILSNKSVVSCLKKMITLNKYSHFVLSGEPGCGKRTLIKIFLNTVTNKDNTLWLNHLSLKTLESKDKLNSFINSKTDEKHKWLIIENLHKMSSQFLYILYNILASKSIVVCVLESSTAPQIDLTSWVVTLKMSPPDTNTLVEVAKYILQKEKRRFQKKLVDKCISLSNNRLCSFLFFLELNYKYRTDLTNYSQLTFSYEDILYESSLKKRLTSIYELETIGFSHMDIVMQLYKYVTERSVDIDSTIELGKIIEHLSHYEHDTYILYAGICRLWKHKFSKLSRTMK